MQFFALLLVGGLRKASGARINDPVHALSQGHVTSPCLCSISHSDHDKHIVAFSTQCTSFRSLQAYCCFLYSMYFSTAIVCNEFFWGKREFLFKFWSFIFKYTICFHLIFHHPFPND